MDTPHGLTAIFERETTVMKYFNKNIYLIKYLTASLVNEAFLKYGLLLKERICSLKRANSFLLK